MLREVFNVRWLSDCLFLLFGDEYGILADAIAKLGLSSPDEVVDEFLDRSPGESIVFTQIQNVVFEAIDSRVRPTVHTFKGKDFPRRRWVEFEHMQIQRVVYELPSLATVFGHPVVASV